MKISFILLALVFGGIAVKAQKVTLSQQKEKDDFIVKAGEYIFFFRKSDMLSSLEIIDKTLKTNNSFLMHTINAGVDNSLDLNSKSLGDKRFIKLFNTSLGCLLLLKAKVAVYKGDKALNEFYIEETPPEADLDGTVCNMYAFSETKDTGLMFHGGLRVELKERK